MINTSKKMGSLLIRILDVGMLFALAGYAFVVMAIRRVIRLQKVFGPPARDVEGPQRIVFLIHDLGAGGAQRQLVLLLNQLDRLRWVPEVNVMDGADSFFLSALERLQIPVRRLRSDRMYRSGLVWQLLSYLLAHPCQILHNWLPDAIQVGAIAGAIAGIPVIIGSMRSESPDRLPQRVEKWRRAMDTLSVRLSTLLIGNSEAVCATNRRWAHVPERRLQVVYNGVEEGCIKHLSSAERTRRRSEMSIDADTPVVGIVARLDEEKDHATFLRAAKLIVTDNPHVQFVVVGEGPLRGQIHGLIERLGLEKSVHMSGHSDDSCATMQLFDVLVLTSVSEGCPNVLMEAAETGVPVVTTAAGGAQEIVKDGETGFVVPCRDHQLLAKCVMQLIDDDRLRQQYIRGARTHVRMHFGAEKMVERVEDLYRRELSRSVQLRNPAPSVRVCFMLSQAFGVFRPHPDRVFGGAEIQVANLAKQLARRDACEVVVLTGDGNRKGRENIEGVSVLLDPLCAPPWPSSCSVNATNGAGEGERRSRFVEWGYRWLAWCPTPLAILSRSLVRGGVVCKHLLRRLLPVDQCIHTARKLSLLLQWVRLLNTIDADVYVTRCAGGIVGCMQRACAIIRRPFVYMVAHDMDVSGDYAAAYPLDGASFERGLRSADLVICQNDNQARLLAERYHKQGRIIPSLSPFELAEDLDHSNRKLVLWIARVDEWKQPELFVRLAERIPDQAFLMVAVASQVHPAQLDKVRKAAAAVPNLRLVPPVPFHESTKLFRHAGVFVNTSRAEGFPNTFLQAAASGTPIVSWVVNPDDMLTRYDMGFCAQEDWVGFEQSIRLLCRDELLRIRMGSNGQEYVRRRHDPESIAETYTDMFLALRNGSPPSCTSQVADSNLKKSDRHGTEALIASTLPNKARSCGARE